MPEYRVDFHALNMSVFRSRRVTSEDGFKADVKAFRMAKVVKAYFYKVYLLLPEGEVR